MRRLLLTVAASAVLVTLAPVSALAKSHHHKKHHKRTHHARVHKAKIRHRRFGNVSTPPATTPAPTTPGAPPADAIGTIQSFTGNVLMIQLNDGTTVTGTVSNDTEIECEAMENEPGDDFGRDLAARRADHGPGGGDNSGGDHSGSGDGGDDNGQGDDNQTDENNNCTTADLMPGTFVRGAELRLSSASATWDKVDLIV